LLVLTLSGCLPDKINDVASCQMQADRFFPLPSADTDSPRRQYIIACMAAKGYDFDIEPADCDSRSSLTAQATCYTPANWFIRKADQVRHSLKLN
jgi:hypothetical protein